MDRLVRIVVGVLAVIGALAIVVGLLTVRGGFGARVKAGPVERATAEWLRDFSIPRAARNARNPVPDTPEVVAHGRRHFAEECATCHGNDGRGADLGKRIFPPVPDLRTDTGDLTDGEIFHVIENGVRWSAMPAFADPDDPEETRSHWEVVRFIRHLPQLTEPELEDMKRYNPRTPEEGEGAEHAHEPEAAGKAPRGGAARPPPAAPGHRH